MRKSFLMMIQHYWDCRSIFKLHTWLLFFLMLSDVNLCDFTERLWIRAVVSRHGLSFEIFILPKAKKYHFIILISGIISSIAYLLQLDFRFIDLIFIFAFIPIVLHLKKIAIIYDNPMEFDPELKIVSLSTFLFAILLLLSKIV